MNTHLKKQIEKLHYSISVVYKVTRGEIFFTFLGNSNNNTVYYIEIYF